MAVAASNFFGLVCRTGPLDAGPARVTLEADAIHLLDLEVTLAGERDDSRSIGGCLQVFAAGPMASLAPPSFGEGAWIQEENLRVNRFVPVLRLDAVAADADGVAKIFAFGLVRSGGVDLGILGSAARFNRSTCCGVRRIVHRGTRQYHEAPDGKGR